MATYCYRTKDGQIYERFFPMGKAPEDIRIGNKRARRDLAAEIGGLREPPGNWPLCSDALGVEPSQTRAAYEDSVAMGVPTEFNREGQAIFRSPRHRKAYAEKLGFVDRNAGCNDPIPQ